MQPTPVLRTVLLVACALLVAGAATAQTEAIANDCPNDQRIVLTKSADESSDRVRLRLEADRCICFSSADSAVQWLTTFVHERVSGGGDCPSGETEFIGPLFAAPDRVYDAELIFGLGGDDDPNLASAQFHCYDALDIENYCGDVKDSLEGDSQAE